MQYPYRDGFSSAQSSFWTHSPWCLLALLLLFCFASSTLEKCFPLRTFFIPGKQKVTQGEILWIGSVGHKGHAVLGQKLMNTQRGVGRCARKSPITKWANALKEPSKKFTEAERSHSQRQLVHWYRWVARTLTQHGKPILQRAHPLEDNSSFGGSPLYIFFSCLFSKERKTKTCQSVNGLWVRTHIH